MRGRYELEQIAAAPLRRAQEDFARAIELDPKYAAAYVGLGVTKQNAGVARGTLPTEAELKDAERLYTQALQIDPLMANAHANLAVLAMSDDWDWGRAEREIQAALAAGRNANAESTYALLLACHGRFEEADEHLRRALDLDPFGTLQLFRSGDIRSWEGRFEQAREQYEKVAARAPQAFGGPICAGMTYVVEGRPDLGMPEFRRVEEKYPQARMFEAMAEARSGNRERALALLRPFEENYQTGGLPLQWFAWVYAFLGDESNAMLWLERSADRRESHALSFAVNPMLRNLHSNPRFRALQRRMGLDQ
jgi:tetratricopeptide (TPR) repeat protein